MKKRLLICDLDNTLYDWVAFFVPSFYALVDEVVRITGCNRNALLDDFREVHQAHHDSELPFALLETKTIRSLFRHRDRTAIAKELDSAFHSFNSKRKQTLHLYPNVIETLDVLAVNKIALVAHTESNLYAAIGRLKRLRVIDFFKRIYCRERSTIAHPNQRAAQDWLETIDRYKPKELSHQQRKPNVDVLLEICRDQACSPDEAAYVGDSLARDVLMAHDAGVFSIWAKYGVAHNTEDYERLVRITHWTNDDIEREKRLRGRTRALQPDLVLERNFSEVLGAFQLADESRPPDLRKRNAS